MPQKLCVTMIYFNSLTVRRVQFELAVSQVIATFPTVVLFKSAQGCEPEG